MNSTTEQIANFSLIMAKLMPMPKKELLDLTLNAKTPPILSELIMYHPALLGKMEAKTKTKTEEKAERYEWLRMNWEREVEKLSVLLAGTGWVRPTVNPYLAKTDCCVSGTMDCVSQAHTHRMNSTTETKTKTETRLITFVVMTPIVKELTFKQFKKLDAIKTKTPEQQSTLWDALVAKSTLGEIVEEAACGLLDEEDVDPCPFGEVEDLVDNTVKEVVDEMEEAEKEAKEKAEEERVEYLFTQISEEWNSSELGGEDLELFQEQMGQDFNDECQRTMKDQFGPEEDLSDVSYNLWKKVWEKLQEVYAF
jgi:hypothetical protein